MNRIRLLTPWATISLANSKTGTVPQVRVDHPPVAGESYQDVTGQPAANIKPSPNVYTVEMVVTDATLTALQNDPAYQPGILWSEPT